MQFASPMAQDCRIILHACDSVISEGCKPSTSNNSHEEHQQQRPC